MLKRPVSGTELKSIRESLGFGQQQLAALLQLGKTRPADGHTVRMWEKGAPIQGPTQIILRLLELQQITVEDLESLGVESHDREV